MVDLLSEMEQKERAVVHGSVLRKAVKGFFFSLIYEHPWDNDVLEM